MTVAHCVNPPYKASLEPPSRSQWAACITLLFICVLMARCAGLPPRMPREPTYALAERDRTALGRLSVHDATSSPSPVSGFRLLPDAAFAFDARISLIRHAELQLTPDGRRVQWIEHDELGDNVVHEDVPGDFLWLRLKNWLLLPFLGGEQLL